MTHPDPPPETNDDTATDTFWADSDGGGADNEGKHDRTTALPEVQ